MIGSLQSGRVSVKLVNSQRLPIDVLCRERICDMTTTTTDRSYLVAVGMAADATFVGCSSSGCVVMTGRTILTKVGMHGMVKLDTIEQLGHSVE
jgi:hypothetical protein